MRPKTNTKRPAKRAPRTAKASKAKTPRRKSADESFDELHRRVWQMTYESHRKTKE